MAPWIEKLSPESSYMVPLGGLLFFTTDASATVHWRILNSFNTVASFKGPDNIVGPNSNDVLAVNAFTSSQRMLITVSGGNASYKLLLEDDAYNYRKANNLPVGRAPFGDVYGG
jgi:hypothetical protein